MQKSYPTPEAQKQFHADVLAMVPMRHNVEYSQGPDMKWIIGVQVLRWPDSTTYHPRNPPLYPPGTT